jgi:hypothetical protein
MEEEHQIPQQISTYQFRLVGDMTIKQFMQVAAGALVALIIYSSGFPGYVKWPLIVISFLAGVAFAFLPLQDRPLSKWVFLFLKSIYSPTIFVWKKTQDKPQFFQPEPTQPTARQIPVQTPLPQKTKTIAPKPQPQVTDEVKPEAKETDSPETDEQEFLTKVSKQFEAVPVVTITAEKKKTDSAKPKPTKQTGGVDIPKSQSVNVGSDSHKPKRDYLLDAFSPTTSTGTQVSPLAGQKAKATQKARFSLEAAPPISPTTENIVVGQVMDPGGKIIEGAILEIRDSYGRPVRALKTNKLGHFTIVTPLIDGAYEILTEKNGFVFEPVSLEASGKIIPPIAIWAKEAIPNPDQQPMSKTQEK